MSGAKHFQQGRIGQKDTGAAPAGCGSQAAPVRTNNTGLLNLAAAQTTAETHGQATHSVLNQFHGLQQLQSQASTFSCTHKHKQEHQQIINVVLPYILEKKRDKMRANGKITVARKTLSSTEISRSVMQKALQYFNGTLGRSSNDQATMLAQHFQANSCDLCDAIVAQLFSLDEMALMKTLDLGVVVELLKDKIKAS